MHGQPSADRQRDLVYCGLNTTWRSIVEGGFRRRAEVLLRGLADSGRFSSIVLPRWVPRSGAFARSRCSRGGRCNIIETPLTRILPERSWLPATRKFNRLLLRRRFLARLKEAGIVEPLVWCYGEAGARMALLLDIPGDWFFDTDHDLLDDRKRRTPRRELSELILQCANRALWVASASRSMLVWLKDHGVSEAVRLRNGVDPARFTPGTAAPTSKRRPLIGYVGVLSPWVDVDLLVDLARRRRDLAFEIIGSWYRRRPDNRLALPNILLTGAMHPDDVAARLPQLDVALGLYRPEPGSDVDSMKFFEYFAAGVPVVTTLFHDDLVQDFNDLLVVARTLEELSAQIDAVLSWSIGERVRWQRQAALFARANTWDHRRDEILQAIDSRMRPWSHGPGK